MMKQGGKDFFCQIYDSTYRKASLLVTSKCGNLEGAGGGDFTFRYVQMDSGAMEIKEIIR